ncbi:MAG: 16S rRNA (cytidine(1402)-2'-O)-methyltransferase [Paracoccaceae bacterium]
MTIGQSGNLTAGLYFIATPIGAARDITLRALDILRAADVLAAEDTRTLRHLMEIHGIPLGGRPLVAYHDHNGEAARPRLIAAIKDGKSVAYASEAGTPLVADPGYQLARAAIAENLPLIAAPGPSAVLCALGVAGLPTDRFLFAGFLPNTASARIKSLTELREIPATLVFYESPRRLARSLADMATQLGGTRAAAVCRELTKRFEEITRGTLGDLAESFASREVKGEIVVVIDRPGTVTVDTDALEQALLTALKEVSLKDAVMNVAKTLGLPRREVYQRALELGDKS